MLSKTLTSSAGYFSSFTDPFTPLEQFYHNSEQGAQAFVDLGLPVFFLSRLAYPGWAIDQLLQSPYSYAQKSLNTPSHVDWAKLSPGAISLADHLAEIKELRRLGIYTSIQVNPILPGIVSHDDVRKLFEMLAEVGNNHVIVKFVEAGYSWAGTMVERLGLRFGKERVARFAELFTENQAGSQRTIQEEYRMEGHRKYRKWATELGMTYATCYEYRKTPEGWKSIGRDFTTADQCHGQRIPMFTRQNVADPFREVTACHFPFSLTIITHMFRSSANLGALM
jgi:DNA repair photolyase